MPDLAAAARRRIRAYLNARPGATSLGAIIEYGPEYDAAGRRPAGCYALDRADLEAILKADSTLHAAVARIRALHHPYRSVHDTDGNSCAHCNTYAAPSAIIVPYPCDTIRALDGEA